jgi:preprotein translocase subunit Sss1
MRKIGVVLLLAGLLGFLIATSQRSGYDSVEGALKSTFSSHERSKKDFWETARWVLAGTAVIGLVFIVLPGKKS